MVPEEEKSSGPGRSEGCPGELRERAVSGFSSVRLAGGPVCSVVFGMVANGFHSWFLSK